VSAKTGAGHEPNHSGCCTSASIPQAKAKTQIAANNIDV